MDVQEVAIDKIKPYPNNPRVNDDAVDKVAESIKQFGFQQPIVVDSQSVVIAGHTRLKAAKKLGLKNVPVVTAKSLSPEQAKAYRLADNKTQDFSDWDPTKLNVELKDIVNIDMNVFGFDTAENEKDTSSGYSTKMEAIDYHPTSEDKPALEELIDLEQYQEIVAKIDGSNLSDELKDFLKYGATRFIKFDFGKIAEYYAQSKKNVQKAFEDQLLVIVDWDNAIEKGLVSFTTALRLEEQKSIGDVDERLK